MEIPRHKLELMSNLRQRGLCDYTCSQLKDLLSLFSTTVLDHRTLRKQDYCALLLDLKPTLRPEELDAAHLIADGHGLASARAALPNVQSKPAPVEQNIDSEVRESQTTVALGPLDRYITRPSRTCAACLQEVPVTSYPRICSDGDCNHPSFSLCSECLAHYIVSQSESFALEAMPCPEVDCAAVLSYQTMQENAPATLFARYEKSINARAITSALDYVECSNATCPSGGIVDVQTMTYMVCNECGTSTCLSCKTPWHPGLSHEENQAAVRAAQAAQRDSETTKHDRRTTQYLRRQTKPCPQCGVAISKNKGCDHMTWYATSPVGDNILHRQC